MLLKQPMIHAVLSIVCGLFGMTLALLIMSIITNDLDSWSAGWFSCMSYYISYKIFDHYSSRVKKDSANC
jgi:hypothetical protein